MKLPKNIIALVALFIILTGLSFTIVPENLVSYNPWVFWVGILLVALGSAILFLFSPFGKARKGSSVIISSSPLSERLIDFMSIRGRLIPYMPAAGVLLIILDLYYNFHISASLGQPLLFGTHDTVTIIFGLCMIGYRFTPPDYNRERDFIFIFFMALMLILVIPLMLVRFLWGDIDASVHVYSSTMLTPQVTSILNMLGIKAYPVGIEIHFELQKCPVNICDYAEVHVTTACSGLYSFSIFGAGFTAFILTEYKRISLKVVSLLGLGLLAAYFANLFRMVIIILISHYYDPTPRDLGNLLVVHANIGWIIFLIWISLFWLILYRFLLKDDLDRAGYEFEEDVLDADVEICQICGNVLGDLRMVTCVWCGKHTHVACLGERTQCPTCQEDMPEFEPEAILPDDPNIAGSEDDIHDDGLEDA